MINLKLQIRRNEDKKISEKIIKDWEFYQFWFEEGNAACDCNRHLFFLEGLGNDTSDIETECSRGKYSVRCIDADTGEILYDEF